MKYINSCCNILSAVAENRYVFTAHGRGTNYSPCLHAWLHVWCAGFTGTWYELTPRPVVCGTGGGYVAFLRTMYLGTWGADMLQHRIHVEHATVQRGCGEIHTCASERMSIITGTCARPLRGRNHGFPFLNAPAEFYIEHWFQRKRCALGTDNCPGNTLVSRLVSLLCFPSTSPHIAFHSPHAAFSVNQLLGGQEKGVEDCAVCILDKVFKKFLFFIFF